MRSLNTYLSLGFMAIVTGAIIAGVHSNQSKPPTQVTIPNPTDALKQAQQLSTEKLTQLEVDDQIRDRLRVDPEWQAIANAIRQDLIIVKWGDGKLSAPVWTRYGAKSYPLLAYYARSRDETRQIYGIAGIRSLGKPYTTIWLEQQIKNRNSNTDFNKITENVNYLLTQTGTPANYGSKLWEREFNLDESVTRDRLIKLAQQNLEPKNSPNYYGQFNAQFLVSLLGYEKVYGAYRERAPISVPQWLEFERIQPTPVQIQAAITYFRSVTPEQRSHIFVERLALQKAGEITNFTKDFFLALARDPKSSNLEKIWAILELDRHSIKDGTDLLQPIINGDFKPLYPLTKLVGYESYDPMGAYAYYLLLGITTKYPQSKFAIACREYGDLVGKSYFGGEPRSKFISTRNTQRSPQEQTERWQTWLTKYPDHPGADDATYFLARSYQANSQVKLAVKTWAKMMTTSIGDGDALYLAFPHIRTLLDIGLSSVELEALIKDLELEPQIQPLSPLFKYALAIRFARSQNYEKALDITKDLDITKMSPQYLDTYYKIWDREEKTSEVIRQIQVVLTEQRSRWQRLQSIQASQTNTTKYQIASDWAGVEGWKNGYFPFWNGYRTYTLPSTTSDNCQWYPCIAKQIPASIKADYVLSTPNTVALSLYQSLLDDPNSPDREKTLYMMASTLLEQWENHEFSETLAIHNLVNPAFNSKPVSGAYSYEQYQLQEKQMLTDYQNRIGKIIKELQEKFPRSTYIDDLLFSSYFLSKDPNYLRRLLSEYPTSDRAAEAKFLLSQRSKSN